MLLFYVLRGPSAPKRPTNFVDSVFRVEREEEMKRGWGLQMRSAVRHPAWRGNTTRSALRAGETARMCTGGGRASLLPRYSSTYSGCPSRPLRLLLRPATTGLLPAVLACADVRQRGTLLWFMR